jgi:hypothetical protein
MTDAAISGDFRDDPIYRELARIFGDLENASFDLVLPLFDEDDAVAFFRTVPAGTAPDDIPARAEEWRRQHPSAPDDLEPERPAG